MTFVIEQKAEKTDVNGPAMLEGLLLESQKKALFKGRMGGQCPPLCCYQAFPSQLLKSVLKLREDGVSRADSYKYTPENLEESQRTK